MNKCLKNISLQIGFDKTVSFVGKSDASKRLEILRNGTIVKTYSDAVNGIFLDSDFSDEFDSETIVFFISKSDVKELFNIDRFFDFRLIFGNELVDFGGVQVLDLVPDCAKKSQQAEQIRLLQQESERQKLIILDLQANNEALRENLLTVELIFQSMEAFGLLKRV